MRTVKDQIPNLPLVLIFCAICLWQACVSPTDRQISPQNNQSRAPADTSSPLAAPTSPVTDYANVLDAATKQRLENKIAAFGDSTNPRVELAVAIVPTTGDRDIFAYSLAVARGWGIGSKESDNPGALLLIAINDRQYFTQVSRDLEDELPDGVTGSVQRQYLVPAFKLQDYGKGISETIDAYIKTIRAKQSEQKSLESIAQPTKSVRSVEGQGR